MKITAIKAQVRRPDRYSIFSDENYLFSLSANELLATDLRLGQELDEEQLAQLKQKATIDKAYISCLDLLARRPRSAWELRHYLRRKDYTGEVTEQIIKRLSQQGYVDDLKFAQAWVNNRRLLKSTSRRRLQQELRQKQVGDDIIQQVLATDTTDERQILSDLVAKKRCQSRYQDPQKLLAYLLRQGYNYDDIKFTLQNIDDNI